MPREGIGEIRFRLWGPACGVACAGFAIALRQWQAEARAALCRPAGREEEQRWHLVEAGLQPIDRDRMWRALVGLEEWHRLRRAAVLWLDIAMAADVQRLERPLQPCGLGEKFQRAALLDLQVHRRRLAELRLGRLEDHRLLALVVQRRLFPWCRRHEQKRDVPVIRCAWSAFPMRLPGDGEEPHVLRQKPGAIGEELPGRGQQGAGKVGIVPETDADDQFARIAGHPTIKRLSLVDPPEHLPSDLQKRGIGSPAHCTPIAFGPVLQSLQNGSALGRGKRLTETLASYPAENGRPVCKYLESHEPDTVYHCAYRR